MLAVGYSVTLHCYEQPEDVPEGVKLSDASDVLPRSGYFTDLKTGYPATFSDVFRYNLMRREDLTYVDCDLYLLKRFPDTDYIFAWESDRFINGAALRLPKDSPLLLDLVTAMAS